MSYESPSEQHLALTLLDAVRTQQTNQILADFERTRVEDEKALSKVSMPEALRAQSMLFIETAIKQAERQEKAKSLLGKVASPFNNPLRLPGIDVFSQLGQYVGHEKVYRTPLLLGTEPEIIDGVSMIQGWVFEAVCYRADGVPKDRIMRIHQAVQDTDSGQQVRRELYNVYPEGSLWSPKVVVHADEFTEYEKVAAAALKAEEPELAAKMARWYETDYDTCAKDPDLHTQKFDDMWNKIHHKTWDYPDELYIMPLGLTMQAIKALGAKTKQKW